VVAQSAQEQRKTDQTVHHDHHNREHRVAGKRGIGVARQHHRADRHDLDAAHAQRQNQRAVWFAEDVGEFVRMRYHHQRTHDNRGEQPQEDRDGDRRTQTGRKQLMIEGEK
jgi:hypothetical protein